MSEDTEQPGPEPAAGTPEDAAPSRRGGRRGAKTKSLAGFPEDEPLTAHSGAREAAPPPEHGEGAVGDTQLRLRPPSRRLTRLIMPIRPTLDPPSGSWAPPAADADTGPTTAVRPGAAVPFQTRRRVMPPTPGPPLRARAVGGRARCAPGCRS